jgi:hypothetical protein
MKNENKQILPALLDKVDAAWTYTIICIAVVMLFSLAALKAAGLIKKTEEDKKEEESLRDPLY